MGNSCDLCPNDADNDDDDDQVCDDIDNCLDLANTTQTDTDNDGIGDLCDDCPQDPFNDSDGDGVCGDEDNCPTEPNADQLNRDGDTYGDACDACPDDPYNNIDGDEHCGDIDNCPNTANNDQTDYDADEHGEACDCYDNDDLSYPGAPELYDGVDNDCDTLIDAEDPDCIGCPSFRIDTLAPLEIKENQSYSYQAHVVAPEEVEIEWTLTVNGVEEGSCVSCGPDYEVFIAAGQLTPGDHSFSLLTKATNRHEEIYAEVTQTWSLRVIRLADLSGAISYNPLLTWQNNPVPVQVDIFNKSNGNLVASSTGSPGYITINLDSANGTYSLTGVEKGLYTRIIQDCNQSDDGLYADLSKDLSGHFETYRRNVTLIEGQNTQNITLERIPLNSCRIKGTVSSATEPIPSTKKINLILFGKDLYNNEVNKKMSLMGEGQYDFSVIYGNYKVLASCKTYEGAVTEEMIIDSNIPVIQNINLAPKPLPSVSTVRQDEGDPQSYSLGLNFRYNKPDGVPRDWAPHMDGTEVDWTDPNNRWLSIRLFDPNNDSDEDGDPENINSPTGKVIYPQIVTPPGIFNVQYLNVLIDLGDISDPSKAKNFMTYLYDTSHQVIGYLVAIRGQVLVPGNPQALLTFVKKFEVDRPTPTQEEVLASTVETIKPTELTDEVPVVATMEVGEGEEMTEVTLQTTFNTANLDPTLLAQVDPNGDKEGAIALDQELDLSIEYKLDGADPNIVIVNIEFTDQNGNPVEYNPPDPNTGERNPDAEPIVLYVPLPNNLQKMIYDPDMTLAKIEAKIAKDPEDFELKDGKWQPKPGLFGIYFETTNGEKEVFQPDAAKGEGIELITQDGFLMAKVWVTHTSQWFTEFIPLPAPQSPEKPSSKKTPRNWWEYTGPYSINYTNISNIFTYQPVHYLTNQYTWQQPSWTEYPWQQNYMHQWQNNYLQQWQNNYSQQLPYLQQWQNNYLQQLPYLQQWQNNYLLQWQQQPYLLPYQQYYR